MSNEKFNVVPNLPAFYKTDSWKNSVCKMSVNMRLARRIEEITRKLPNMSLEEKREIWTQEPYYEISKLITSSKDWKFPQPKDKEKKA